MGYVPELNAHPLMHIRKAPSLGYNSTRARHIDLSRSLPRHRATCLHSTQLAMECGRYHSNM
jgi:hypothetical protein